MNIEKEERIDLPFVLTSNEIKQITDMFTKSENIIFRSTCADKIVREFTSLEDLLNYENPPNREIYSLGINVISKEGKKILFMNFTDYAIDNIFIQLKGEEKEILELSRSLNEKLHAIGSWYGFISRTRYSGTIIGIIISWIALIPIFAIGYKNSYWSAEYGKNFYLIYLFLILISSFGINAVWSKIRNLYFPMAVFAIGQGIKRQSDKDIIRTSIILAFFVGLITSIVFSILQ